MANIYTLTSWNGGGTQTDNFKVYNTATDFTCSFREPIRIAPRSLVRIQFAKFYLASSTDFSPMYITCPSLTTMNSQMAEIGPNGVLGISNRDDANDAGGKASIVDNNQFAYVSINNAEWLNISELQIKLLDVDGSINDSVWNGTQTEETATTIVLHIIPSSFKQLV